MSRPEVVAALISGIGAMDGMDYGLLLETATPAEIHEATIRLREAALSAGRTPDVLAFDLWTVAKLAAQGRCLEYVAESLPIWRGWPDKSLADVLKTESPERCALIRDALHRSGLDVELVGPPDVGAEPDP
jgi:hypothetical protein